MNLIPNYLIPISLSAAIQRGLLDRRAKVTLTQRREWLGMDSNSISQAWSCRHNLQLQKSLEKLVDRSGRK